MVCPIAITGCSWQAYGVVPCAGRKYYQAKGPAFIPWQKRQPKRPRQITVGSGIQAAFPQARQCFSPEESWSVGKRRSGSPTDVRAVSGKYLHYPGYFRLGFPKRVFRKRQLCGEKIISTIYYLALRRSAILTFRSYFLSILLSTTLLPKRLISLASRSVA